MFAALMACLLLQRGLELALAQRNRRWALLQGGRESGRRHYPLLVALHALFYASLALEYTYLSAGWSPVWFVWLALLVLAQALRIWAIRSLGRLWNTRIIVIPGWKPVITGPYRFIRHPNYAAVLVEVLAIPAMCGAYLTAVFFSAANALALHVRIREEERALEQIGGIDLNRMPRFLPALDKKVLRRAVPRG